MSIQVIDRSFPSTDGEHTLIGKVYVPEGEIKGLFHLVHGMTEHIGRYDKFMTEIAEAGYLCFAYDNLGHGKTADADGTLGFIAHKDGWKKLVEDVYSVGCAMKKAYGKELPYYLMGHSMGSFIVRLCAQWHPGLMNRLIVMGTGGPNPASGAGLAAINTLKLFKGERGYSKAIEGMAFGKYNERFGEGVSGDWLSKDPKVREVYDQDRFCNYHFTLSAMHDLIMLQSTSNKKEWFDDMSRELPILLVSGADDPVGDYGHGVKKVFDGLKGHGAKVQFKLYSDCRHEILNDDSHATVVADILRFIA